VRFRQSLAGGQIVKERKLPIIGAAIACIISGIAGAIVAVRMHERLPQWPSGDLLTQCIWSGVFAGIIMAVITALLILAAAREKIWLVTLVGCIIAFSAAWAYEEKKLRDLDDVSREMFGPRGV
jgi:hypothetical protein